jgi:MATE family multidrug resistance protein
LNAKPHGLPPALIPIPTPQNRLGWGAEGAAAAVLACSATNAALLNGWRLVRDLGPGSARPTATWAGCSPRAALSGWGQFLTVALPAVAMICCEWWSWELMILAAGWLPNAAVAISVMGVGFQVSSLGYMLPASLGSATATRVANALGAGSARGRAPVATIMFFA